LHPDEGRPAEDPVINHTVIKADVRGSTGITKDLLARGMNPASHISMSLHEPVKRMLERYGAATVFIEGDAIILAIYETESTRATTRGVARACVLAREILAHPDWVAAAELPERRRRRVLGRLVDRALGTGFSVSGDLAAGAGSARVLTAA